MADIAELLTELVEVAHEILRSIDRIEVEGFGGAPGASGGGPGSGAAKSTSASKKTAGGEFRSGLTGQLGIPTDRLAAARLAGRAAGGAALAAGAAAFATSATAAGAFISSGGSGQAASGAVDNLFSRGINAVGLGGVTGDSAALAISQRAQADVGRIAEAAARAGGPLSKEQLTALSRQAGAREERVEDARRDLQTVTSEQFGEIKGRERDKAGERFEQAIDKLISFLTSRQGL